MGLMMMCCGRAVKMVGMLRVSVVKMKALTVRVETVTVIGDDVKALQLVCVLEAQRLFSSDA